MVESCGKAALLTDEDVVPVSQVDRGWLCNRLLQASTLRAVDRRRDEGLAGDAEGGTVGDEAAGEPLGDSGGAGQQVASLSGTSGPRAERSALHDRLADLHVVWDEGICFTYPCTDIYPL